MRKKLAIIIPTLLAIIVMLYLIMLFDTNALMKEVSEVFQGKVALSETKNRAIDQYNIAPFNNDVEEVNLKITRTFVLHNFSTGYIWVSYTIEMRDSNGELLCGSWDVPARWTIKKEKGKWEIVEILEAP